MVISSLVVDTRTDMQHRVAEQIAAMQGCEVHGIEKNHLVVTIEAESIDASHVRASSFIELAGVMNINLIYANFEDDPTLKAVQA